LASGTYTLSSVSSDPAPSMRAASSSSRGIDLNVWRMRKMPNAEPKYGMPMATIVSTRPMAAMVR